WLCGTERSECRGEREVELALRIQVERRPVWMVGHSPLVPKAARHEVLRGVLCIQPLIDPDQRRQRPVLIVELIHMGEPGIEILAEVVGTGLVRVTREGCTIALARKAHSALHQQGTQFLPELPPT